MRTSAARKGVLFPPQPVGQRATRPDACSRTSVQAEQSQRQHHGTAASARSTMSPRAVWGRVYGFREREFREQEAVKESTFHFLADIAGPPRFQAAFCRDPEVAVHREW